MGALKNKNMISMTSIIFYKGKQYACEFVKNVFSEDIKGTLRIYASRNDNRVFLVTEFNEVLATETLASYQLDAILDEESENFEFETMWLCCDFGQELNTTIKNDLITRSHSGGSIK